MANYGTDTSSDALNTRMCALMQARHLNATEVIAFAAYVDGIGTAGLELSGFDSTEATNFASAVDQAKTEAQVWLGQATQGTDYNFSDALSVFIGPDPQD